MLTDAERKRLDTYFSPQTGRELTLRRAERIAAETNTSLRAVQWFALQKGIVPACYQRNVGTVGIEGQSRLLESRALVVGLGGLAGHVVEQLARVGVGRIVGVDPDVFEETNLNRQPLCRTNNLGCSKVHEARQRLLQVNPAVEFTGHSLPLQRLPEAAYGAADVVFDCLDNVRDRLALAGKCSQADVPLVHGAIAGWYGQVGVIWPGTAMLGRIYQPQSKGIEQDLGNPAFTAALAAGLMVAEGVKLLTAKRPDRQARLLFFDLQENEYHTIAL